jgi:hypothetical protein
VEHAVIGIGDRATALHAVLLALEASAVVPPIAAAARHGQIGFLSARPYLETVDYLSRLFATVVKSPRIGAMADQLTAQQRETR